MYQWQHQLSAYDHNVANQSLQQLKCGFQMLQLGSTAIGVKTKEGVVLSVEKRVTSTLLVSATFQTGACTLQSCSAYYAWLFGSYFMTELTGEPSITAEAC